MAATSASVRDLIALSQMLSQLGRDADGVLAGGVQGSAAPSHTHTHILRQLLSELAGNDDDDEDDDDDHDDDDDDGDESSPERRDSRRRADGRKRSHGREHSREREEPRRRSSRHLSVQSEHSSERSRSTSRSHSAARSEGNTPLLAHTHSRGQSPNATRDARDEESVIAQLEAARARYIGPVDAPRPSTRSSSVDAADARTQTNASASSTGPAQHTNAAVKTKTPEPQYTSLSRTTAYAATTASASTSLTHAHTHTHTQAAGRPQPSLPSHTPHRGMSGPGDLDQDVLNSSELRGHSEPVLLPFSPTETHTYTHTHERDGLEEGRAPRELQSDARVDAQPGRGHAKAGVAATTVDSLLDDISAETVRDVAGRGGPAGYPPVYAGVQQQQPPNVGAAPAGVAAAMPVSTALAAMPQYADASATVVLPMAVVRAKAAAYEEACAEVDALTAERDVLMDRLDVANAKIAAFDSEFARDRSSHRAEIDRMTTAHQDDMARMRTTHAAEVDRILSSNRVEAERVRAIIAGKDESISMLQAQVVSLQNQLMNGGARAPASPGRVAVSGNSATDEELILLSEEVSNLQRALEDTRAELAEAHARLALTGPSSVAHRGLDLPTERPGAAAAPSAHGAPMSTAQRLAVMRGGSSSTPGSPAAPGGAPSSGSTTLPPDLAASHRVILMLDRDLQDLRNKFGALQRELEAAHTEAQNRLSEANRAQAALDAARAQLSTLEKDARNSAANLLNSEAECEKLRRRVMTADDKQAELVRTIDALRTELGEARARLKSAEDAQQRMQRLLQDAEAGREDAMERVRMLQQQLQAGGGPSYAAAPGTPPRATRGFAGRDNAVSPPRARHFEQMSSNISFGSSEEPHVPPRPMRSDAPRAVSPGRYTAAHAAQATMDTRSRVLPVYETAPEPAPRAEYRQPERNPEPYIAERDRGVPPMPTLEAAPAPRGRPSMGGQRAPPMEARAPFAQPDSYSTHSAEAEAADALRDELSAARERYLQAERSRQQRMSLSSAAPPAAIPGYPPTAPVPQHGMDPEKARRMAILAQLHGNAPPAAAVGRTAYAPGGAAPAPAFSVPGYSAPPQRPIVADAFAPAPVRQLQASNETEAVLPFSADALRRQQEEAREREVARAVGRIGAAEAARTREASAPYSTAAAEASVSSFTADREAALLQANMVKASIVAELERLGPAAPKTLRERQRKAELQSQLADVDQRLSDLRLWLKANLKE